MKTLNMLYLCWVIFCIIGWFISPIIGHNPNRVEEFFIMLGWIIFPPMIVNLWLFATKRNKKYLMMFCVLFLYYPLGYILFAIITRMSFVGA
ncbi:hypothetical protein DMC01_04910 [Campylobacter troglodytis]|nr:hypothetical protein DMC01_04910 [Campylobacter troglodytis]